MGIPMELQNLSDADLMAQSKEWRLRALRGDKNAHGFAHELERELRRRHPTVGVPQPLPSTSVLSYMSVKPLRRWRLW